MRGDLRQGNLGDDSKSPYHEKRKYPEPTICTNCALVYHKGRWSQADPDTPPAGDPHRERCPACRRISDGEPGGLVFLSGGYLRDKHKLSEILNVVKNQEQQARADRPLQRVMWVERGDGEVEIATTNVHLAQRIGKAVHNAHSGDLEIKYADGSRFARVYWKRDA